MPDYLLKDIPEEKIREFKTACAHFEQTMRKAFLDGMELIIAAYQLDISKLKVTKDNFKTKGK